ncbi:2-C-methyl-D-erythritol 4-phosphate cytidylyltransferase [Sessilibacter corallicola]|uniref:2-C-methyl-D-erythritol 4-phosphate cytidylyltransferase n=1 Tax=Sessilibacter corallicola TaxID=2904075 RepID=UPI001E54BC32|nr:2-C-methyl-D-erythritol 4-phosphate cytidylyltransferase [Sessilibacter corallicola]MCE2026799.1 2-C-methyl-D-erythritol 4-phosphate cytidylyltransferase [Sessilibacter corallicola]
MHSSPKFWAVIPAAGIGSRFGSETPKQYLTLLDKTILEHTIEKFLACEWIEKVVVALRQDDPFWPSLSVANHHRVLTVLGGGERADSVLSGLNALQNIAGPDDWALVHDAARPCVTKAQLSAMKAALEADAVGGIMAQSASDTIKIASANTNTHSVAAIESTIDRNRVWLAQTPQMFRVSTLQSALTDALKNGQAVTDEASAIELANLTVKLFPGSRNNIKVTLPEDLALAEAILRLE